MTIENIIWLIPLAPILAFFLIVLLTNRSKWLSHTIAILAALISAGLTFYVIYDVAREGHLAEQVITSMLKWFPTGDSWFTISVLVDPLTLATLFFVSITILMIFIYSVGYHNFGAPKGDHDRPGLQPHGATLTDAHGHKQRVMSIEPMYSRFFAFFGLFAFGMYLLVTTGNLLILFVGWEIMGLCSYLLIGFWYAKPSARAAAIKAFLTTRIADVLMLLGIAYLYFATGTLNFHEIFVPEVLERLALEPALNGFLGLSIAGLVGILIIFGTIGKSAQFPLHVWLPDAMEGPTPVSAMIHAATMVSAGVYLVIRFFPLLSAGWEGHGLTPPMTLMAFIGAFTAILSATIAIAQNDVKRVLAYSTISQLGFMIAALGIGGYVAATFHLVTHAFFKALLFLGSGSVIHGVEHGVFHTGEHLDPQDMYNMGGLRRKMPITFWTFLIGGFALAGFPILTAGFWSKDEILAEAYFHSHWPIFITLALAALITAFYTMRQITLTFLGEPRTKAAEHARESHWTMTLPLVILAVFALAVGWLGIPEEFPLLGGLLPNLAHEVGGALPEHPEAIPFSVWPLLTSLVVSLGGLTLGWLVYRNVKVGQPDPLAKPLGPLWTVLKNKYYFDELYDFLFIRPAQWMAEDFAIWMDENVIDGILHGIASIGPALGSFFRNYIDKPIVNGFGDWIADTTRKIGVGLRVIQTGRVQQYMVMALVSLVAFGIIFYLLLVQ